MQKPYISLYGQLVYVLISGLLLLFVPNILLTLVGFAPATEIWIRVMGLLVLALSFYYYAMAQYGNRAVVQSTVRGRVFFCAGLVTLVLLGLVKPALLGFALAETGLAYWTSWELRHR